MKHLSIRIDESLNEILQRNAERQGIKVTRYVRSLIEKGLVVEHQMTTEHSPVAPVKNSTSSQNEWTQLMEIMIECTILTRWLTRHAVGQEEEYKTILTDAVQRAKEYVRKQSGGKLGS